MTSDESAREARVTNEQTDGVECPYCESENTILDSPFGSTILKSQYHCEDCRNVFEHIKWEV
jgi:transposase-like protein